jgi:hypothetical protein
MHPSTEAALSPFPTSTTKKAKGYPQINLPVYDNGGNVSVEASRRLQSSGDAGIQNLINAPDEPLIRPAASAEPAGKSIGENIGSIISAIKPTPKIKQPTYMPRTSAQKAAAEPDVEAPLIAMPAPNMKNLPSAIAAPVADSGGDVPIDVNDGQHQIAILQDGEKVLTPEEADAYRTQQSTMKPLGAPQSKPSIGRIEPTTADSTETQVTARGTPEERAAIKTDKQKAMGSGDLVALGKAALAERHLEPSTSDVSRPIAERPTAGYPKITLPQEEHQATAGGPLISGAPSTETPSEQRDLRNMERKARVADLEKQRQAALSAGDLETADKLAVAKSELQKTPWADRTLLGKIGHVASVAGNVAGDVLIPNVMAQIPGTALNRSLKEQSAYGRILPDTEADLRQAQTEAASKKEPVTKEWQEISGGAIDPKHPELGAQPAFYNKNNPDEGIKFGNVPLAPKSGAEKTAPATTDQVADYQQRIKNSGLTGDALAVYGTAPKNATAAELDKRFDEATKLRGMNATDQRNKIDEQARADAAAEHKREHEETRGSKLVNYRDKNGDLVSGTRSEAEEAGVQNKNIHGETSAPLQEKARQAYTQYGRILENTQAAMDTMPAWNNETDRKAAMDVAKQYWEHLTGSVVIAGVGVNPEYTQQQINSDAYQRMSKAGQAHMQNMFQLWSDAINIVKQETGGVPRGQVFLQKEDAILPHPDKTQTMNEKSLQNLAKRIRTDAKEFARPSDMEPLGGVIPFSATGLLRSTETKKPIGYVDAEGVHRDFDGNKMSKE